MRLSLFLGRWGLSSVVLLEPEGVEFLCAKIVVISQLDPVPVTHIYWPPEIGTKLNNAAQ